VEYADGRDTLTFCDSHSDPGCHGVQAKRLKVRRILEVFLVEMAIEIVDLSLKNGDFP
jgi:hypothetical protein